MYKLNVNTDSQIPGPIASSHNEFSCKLFYFNLNIFVVMNLLSLHHCFPTDLNLLVILSVLFNDANLLVCSILFLVYGYFVLMIVFSVLVSINHHTKKM
jgi:hypothetical protein